jgi:uncharacterized protein (DUF1684 family)
VTDDPWRHLIAQFIARHIDVDAFHDRFFELRRASLHAAQEIPEPVERLFYAVEAYCPDPALRDPASRYEADEAEVRNEAQLAWARLAAAPRLRTST